MIRSAPLLGAKLLRPATGPLHLPRPRLMDRLRAGLDRRATVVVAGPGYGKTALLARFLEECGEDSVWYSLDPSDRNPSVLLRYLVRGIKEHAPDFGESSQGFWEALRFRPEEAERLADVFIGDAEESLGGRIILVLDGVQHLDGAEPCARALRRLLAYLPGAVHLILSGRSLPALGLKPLVAGGAVTLIEGGDLAFTLDETRALLHETFGLPAGPEAAERLHGRTRGWITALQLLRHTAQLEADARDLPEALFARTEPEIFDYFSEEVLAAEPWEVREFLLGSCPPAEIDPEICAEVLQGIDVRGILAGLVHRHLFLSVLECRNARYTYDPLFLDYLRRKLHVTRGAEAARELDLRYGRACARRGAFAPALRHFLAAENAREVIGLLQRHGEALVRAGLLGAVHEAALFLASRGVRSPDASALWGEACRLAGDHGAAVGHFDAALAGSGGEEEPIRGRSRVAALQGLAYSLLKTGDVARAAGTAEQALAETEATDHALRARVLNTLAIVRYRQDRSAEALEHWQDALAHARQAADRHLTLMIAHNLGLPHAVAGDFRRAAECFRILTSPDSPRLGPEEGAAYLNLARIATLRGDYDGAASHLDDAREIAHKSQLRGLLADVLEEEGNLCRERGDLEAARERYARARVLLTELGRPDLLDSLAGEEAILAARRGDFGEAASLAAEAVARRRAAGDPEGTAAALLAQGEVNVRARAPRRAAVALVEAAAYFTSTGREYQECVARLWLSLARHLQRDRHHAVTQALRALEIAERHDYRTTVLKIAACDRKFRDLLASLGEAPSYLRETPVADPGSGRADRPDDRVAARRAAPGGGGADLTVRLLGPVEVYRDAQRAVPAQAWTIRRALQVFCYLAAARDHRASRDRLADALWGDARPSAIERNFHPTISFLRRALNHGHGVRKNFIQCEGDMYLLNPAYRYDIDTEKFEGLVEAARHKEALGDAPGALADYEEALALYRGPLMEECYDGWIDPLRARYDDLHAAALGEAGDLHLACRAPEPAAACFRGLLDRDPVDTRASARLMRALAALGDREGIEREFARLGRAFAGELSMAPPPETRRAYEDALAAAGPGGGDMARAEPPRPRPEPARRAPGTGREVARS